MSEKPYYYSKKNKSKAEEADKEKEAAVNAVKYVLIWHSSVILEQQIYYPGDVIEEEIYHKMPRFIQIQFWEIGRELTPQTFNKLSKHLQKYFKMSVKREA
jgi:hypothetical protein